MLSNIDTITSASSAWASRLASRVDSNTDGVVTKDEFVANAPDNVDGTTASTLFDALDSQGTGALSATDLASAFQQLATQLQAALIQLQASGGGEQQAAGGPPDAAKLFARIDTDGDGEVSREEFITGRPDDMSEEQASSLFDQLAGEDADSLTEEQFTAAMMPPPPPGGMGGAPMDPSELFASLDTDGDGALTLAEFIAGKPDDMTEEEATALFNQIAGEDSESITEEQFAAAMPPPPAGGAVGGGGGESESYDPLDTNKDGVVSLQEYLAGQDGSDAVSSLLDATESSDTGTSGTALQQILAAIESYQSLILSDGTSASTMAQQAVSISA